MSKIDLEDYRGIIFDLDGTIYDIVGSVKQAVEDGVEKYKLKDKLKVSMDEALSEVAHLIEDLQNYPIPKIILNSYNLLQISLLEGQRLIKKLRIVIYVYNQFNKYNEDAGIFPNIEDIISKLHEQNKKLAILTNNKNTHAEEVLKKFNLNQYFDLIIGFNEVSEVKPNPEGILKILDTWKIKPSEAIFIGDMVTDIQAGKAANVKMVCIASGLAPKNTLLECNPDALVDNTLELKKLFKL